MWQKVFHFSDTRQSSFKPSHCLTAFETKHNSFFVPRRSKEVGHQIRSRFNHLSAFVLPFHSRAGGGKGMEWNEFITENTSFAFKLPGFLPTRWSNVPIAFNDRNSNLMHSVTWIIKPFYPFNPCFLFHENSVISLFVILPDSCASINLNCLCSCLFWQRLGKQAF